MLYRENSHRFTLPEDRPFFWHYIFLTVEASTVCVCLKLLSFVFIESKALVQQLGLALYFAASASPVALMRRDTEVLRLRKCSAKRHNVLHNIHLNCYRFFSMSLVLGGLFCFFSGPRSLQYTAERLGWSGSLLLQTEAALISDYGREQS